MKFRGRAGVLPITHGPKTQNAPREGAKLAHSITIKIASGGTLKLEGDYNAFSLTSEDRSFIDRIVSMLTEYDDFRGQTYTPGGHTSADIGGHRRTSADIGL